MTIRKIRLSDLTRYLERQLYEMDAHLHFAEIRERYGLLRPNRAPDHPYRTRPERLNSIRGYVQMIENYLQYVYTEELPAMIESMRGYMEQLEAYLNELPKAHEAVLRLYGMISQLEKRTQHQGRKLAPAHVGLTLITFLSLIGLGILSLSINKPTARLIALGSLNIPVISIIFSILIISIVVWKSK
jgi:hypothetical protein